MGEIIQWRGVWHRVHTNSGRALNRHEYIQRNVTSAEAIFVFGVIYKGHGWRRIERGCALLVLGQEMEKDEQRDERLCVSQAFK